MRILTVVKSDSRAFDCAVNYELSILGDSVKQLTTSVRTFGCEGVMDSEYVAFIRYDEVAYEASQA